MEGNISTEYCQETPRVDQPLPHIIGSIIAVFGVITNSTMIIALVRNPKLRKNAYISLVILLSICDIFICLSALMIISHKNINDHEGGTGHRMTCSIALHLQLTGLASSLGQTLLICINRILATTGHTESNKRLFYEWRKYVSSAAMFLFWNAFYLSMIPLQNNLPSVEVCGVCSLYIGAGYRLMVILNTSAFFGMFLAILTLYIILLFIIRRQRKKIRPGPVVISVTQSANADQDNPNGRVTLTMSQQQQSSSQVTCNSGQKFRIDALKTLTILLTVFSALTLPLLVTLVLKLYNALTADVLAITFSLALLNTVTNPILYTWRFAELRLELKRLFQVK